MAACETGETSGGGVSSGGGAGLSREHAARRINAKRAALDGTDTGQHPIGVLALHRPLERPDLVGVDLVGQVT